MQGEWLEDYSIEFMMNILLYSEIAHNRICYIKILVIFMQVQVYYINFSFKLSYFSTQE